MAEGDIGDSSDVGAVAAGSAIGGEATLGAALRRAREQRGLTIQQIAATTRIPARHLEALERDDLGAVPGGMYLRSEIRTYADAVGLDRSVALGYLRPASEPSAAADAAVLSGVAPASPEHGTRWRVVIASACLVAAAIVGWRWEQREPATSSGPVLSEEGRAPDSATHAVTAAPEPASDLQRPITTTTPVPAGTSGTTASAALPASATTTLAEPPPAPAVVQPELEIVSEPAGARVTIDGIGWGVTPVTIRFLPPGTKHLRLTRDGFAAVERVIQLAADEPHTSVRIELSRTD
jgi:cytoskeletal protein RodZ